MRNPRHAVLVWADAISINQSDHNERSAQVEIMGEIYSKGMFMQNMTSVSASNHVIASFVWIWLGESGEDSDSAMEFVNSVGTREIENQDFRLEPSTWSAVRSLLNRPWWTRLWVVQETLLARRAVVNCGWKVAPFEFFVRLKEIQSQCVESVEPRLEPIQSGLITSFGVVLLDWNRLREELGRDRITIFQLVTVTSDFQCKERIDRIFTLRAMCCSQEQQVIEIDYSLCLRCVNVNVAKSIFKRLEVFGPLRTLQTHQQRKDTELGL